MHAVEELLSPKEEPQDVDNPQEEEQRVDAPTHANKSKNGNNHSREADKLVLDARDNVGAPTSQHRQRRSLDRYTGYMALMSESVEIEPFSFKEEVRKTSMG